MTDATMFGTGDHTVDLIVLSHVNKLAQEALKITEKWSGE